MNPLQLARLTAPELTVVMVFVTKLNTLDSVKIVSLQNYAVMEIAP